MILRYGSRVLKHFSITHLAQGQQIPCTWQLLPILGPWQTAPVNHSTPTEPRHSFRILLNRDGHYQPEVAQPVGPVPSPTQCSPQLLQMGGSPGRGSDCGRVSDVTGLFVRVEEVLSQDSPAWGGDECAHRNIAAKHRPEG